MTNKIHVLADESLCGSKREYVEVERKAEVGDMVVCIDDCIQGGRYYRVGDVGKMLYKNEEYPSICVKFVGCQGGSLAVEESFVGNDAYRTLEPTDIVHIESDDSPGVRYELVDRKAEVGERVIINKGDKHIGLTGKVTHVYGDGNISVDVGENFDYYPYLFLDEYSVLESVESESSPKTTDDIIANLTRRVAELERRDEAQRRLNGVLSQRINATHRDIETWAQEVETLNYVVKRIDDKIEMCIDDIVTLDERTNLTQQISVIIEAFAKVIGGAR